MKEKRTKKLIVLDLDNTLIYASFFPLEGVRFLFHYSEYLTVYERPFARDFINKCQKGAEIVVFTTAIADYAKKVCKALEMKPKALLSRKDCAIAGDRFFKKLRKEWLDGYNEIIIVDDSPEVWDETAHQNCAFLVPERFMGEPGDAELKKIAKQLPK